jgi:O-succinylbenzoic acid--CoA ligase
LPPNTVGRVVIRAKSQFLGYYPDFTDNPPPLITDDLGYIDESGYLYVLGRNSQKIVTGGENVYPLEVESALRATNLLQDVAVVGIADRLWGQVIAAVYVPVGAHVTSSLLKDALSNQLARFKIPKYWLEVDALPRNAQGKVIYQQLQSAVRDSCKINFQPRVDA